MNTRDFVMIASLTAAAAALAGASGAAAQSVSTAGEWERPFGSSGQESQPYRAGTRDAAGNRVIANGIVQTGVGVSGETTGGTSSIFRGGVGQLSSATAIGNVLNVNVQGRYNTVIVNSTQINNGDVTANSETDGLPTPVAEPGQNHGQDGGSQ